MEGGASGYDGRSPSALNVSAAHRRIESTFPTCFVAPGGNSVLLL